jgi:hypothetical protein
MNRREFKRGYFRDYFLYQYNDEESTGQESGQKSMDFGPDLITMMQLYGP